MPRVAPGDWCHYPHVAQEGSEAQRLGNNWLRQRRPHPSSCSCASGSASRQPSLEPSIPFPACSPSKSSGLSSCSSEQRGLHQGQQWGRRQEETISSLSVFFMLVSLGLAHRWCSINVCWMNSWPWHQHLSRNTSCNWSQLIIDCDSGSEICSMSFSK